MRFVLVLVLAAVIPAATAASGAQPASRFLVTAQGVGSPPRAVVEIVDQTGRVERVVAHPGFTQSLAARPSRSRREAAGRTGSAPSARAWPGIAPAAS